MVILIGPAGAGKSVQGEMLVEKNGYDWVSLGHLLRECVEDPELKERMAAGELLEDEYVEPILAKTILEHEDSSKLILDGFPRNAKQATWLLDFVKDKGLQVQRVVHLKLDPEIAKQRLMSRGRADDNEQVIDTRRAIYDKETAAVLSIMREGGVKVGDIDASADIDTVHRAVVSFLQGA